MKGLLKGGADAILIETSQDLGQIKIAVRAARQAMAELKLERPLWVQVTVETSGTLLLGTDIASVISTVEMLDVDVLGLNCGTGPDEMHAALAVLAETSPFDLSCLPNAGLPVNEDGKLVYNLGPEAFAEKVAHAAKEFSLNIVGGCCGTTPEYIRALRAKLSNWNVTHRTPTLDRAATSLYQAVSLRQEPRPLIVGERTNANGSKLFRDLLAEEDYDGLVGIAKEQQRESAHMLDVCVAYVGRDEVRDMEEYLKRLVTQTTLPLMLDSTEVAGPRAGAAGGARQVRGELHQLRGRGGQGPEDPGSLQDLRRGGGGPHHRRGGHGQDPGARSWRWPSASTTWWWSEYGFNPSDLIIDPLTFTLGSGDEDFRGSAVETLEAIRAIKARFHGTLTMLGVSNVSFGLKPAARHVLNALMLYHGVQAGLDLAIFNASKVIPVARIPEDQRKAARISSSTAARRATIRSRWSWSSSAPQAPRLGGRPPRGWPRGAPPPRTSWTARSSGSSRTWTRPCSTTSPSSSSTRCCWAAMKVVGERFGAGEMQLPFVLESAEAMKAAIQRIEPHLPKEASTTKGRVDPGDGEGRRTRHRQEPGGDHPLQQRLRGGEPGHQAAHRGHPGRP